MTHVHRLAPFQQRLPVGCVNAGRVEVHPAAVGDARNPDFYVMFFQNIGYLFAHLPEQRVAHCTRTDDEKVEHFGF